MVDNPWLRRRVIAYAHQGGAREAPSSTLYAIARAVEVGAPAIELDVHATADRQIVVCHDPTLERTTSETGEIRHRTLAELQEIDNSYWFVEGEDVKTGRPEASYTLRGRAPADHRYGIASLEEILEQFPGVILNLDIKRTAPEVEPYEDVLAELLRRHGRSDDVIVASFNDAATESFSRYAPEIPTSAGTTTTSEFYRSARAGGKAPESVARHVALQVPATFGAITVVDERFVDAAHAAGLAVHVWTIDDRKEMERLLDVGVDGIISDSPSVLTALLAERGVAWHP
ncbi:MAG: glycerophosphodiester phosphodiesterase [Acidimicrobiales bacterium]|jgi:glycerophosphoryl diester phosphodiesterase